MEMKFVNSVLIVEDLERSEAFYTEVLSLKRMMEFDYGNVKFSCGISLQQKKNWMKYIGAPEDAVCSESKNTELYFEEENFDRFLRRLERREDIRYVHEVMTHDWGQRVVRFYDPDGHIVEVGESMKAVCHRFLDEGMDIYEVAQKTRYPVGFVRACADRVRWKSVIFNR